MNDPIYSVSFRFPAQRGVLTIVIPVYRDAAGLCDTLQSIACCAQPADIQVQTIVANDGGDSQISSICISAGVECLNIVPNRGSYNARMTALEYARGSAIAFLDADVVVNPNWLASAWKALSSADYIGGPIRITQSLVNDGASKYEQVVAFAKQTDTTDSVFFVTANLIVRRDVFVRYGGFDPRLRSGGDREFGERVSLSAQVRKKLCVDCRVSHPPRGLRKLLAKANRVQSGKVTLYRLYRKRYSPERPSIRKVLGKFAFPPVCFVRRYLMYPRGFFLRALAVAVIVGATSAGSFLIHALRSHNNSTSVRGS